MTGFPTFVSYINPFNFTMYLKPISIMSESSCVACCILELSKQVIVIQRRVSLNMRDLQNSFCGNLFSRLETIFLLLVACFVLEIR